MKVEEMLSFMADSNERLAHLFPKAGSRAREIRARMCVFLAYCHEVFRPESAPRYWSQN
jgi:hypothetical protein